MAEPTNKLMVTSQGVDAPGYTPLPTSDTVETAGELPATIDTPPTIESMPISPAATLVTMDTSVAHAVDVTGSNALSFTPLLSSSTVGNGEFPTTLDASTPASVSAEEKAQRKKKKRKAKDKNWSQLWKLKKKQRKAAGGVSATVELGEVDEPPGTAVTTANSHASNIIADSTPHPHQALQDEIGALQAELDSLRQTQAWERNDYNVRMAVLASENASLQQLLAANSSTLAVENAALRQQLSTNDAYFTQHQNNLMCALSSERQQRLQANSIHGAQLAALTEYQKKLAACDAQIATLTANKALVEDRIRELEQQLNSTREQALHSSAIVTALTAAVGRMKHMREEINTTLIPAEFAAYKQLLSEKISTANSAIDGRLLALLSNSFDSYATPSQLVVQRIEGEAAQATLIREEFAMFVKTEFAPLIKRLRAQHGQDNGTVPVHKWKV